MTTTGPILTPLKKNYFFAGCLSIAAGLPFADLTPFFITFGTLLCTAPFVFENTVKENLAKILKNRQALLIALLWVLVFISGLYSENREKWWDLCSRKLPLLLLPLGLAAAPKLSLKQFGWFFIVFNTAVSIVAVGSAIHYFLNYKEITALLLESKPVPIWPVGQGISHIYFGILMCFTILNCAYYFMLKEKLRLFKNEKALFIFFLLLNFAIIHIITARTGLVALYASLGCMVLYAALTGKQKKKAIIILIILPLLPVLAYFAVPSFHNKVINAAEDITITKEGGDINHRSLSMRFEAWKTGIHAIEKHPITGVGAGDAEYTMQLQYLRDNTHLYQENRIMPHNQFIESGVGMGIVYILLLLAAVFYPLFRLRKSNVLLLCSAIMLFFSMLVESILERQIGLVLFPLLLLLLPSLNRED